MFCWAFLGHAGFCWRHHECFPGRVITNAFLGFAFAKLCCGFPRLCRKYFVLLGFSGLCWALLGRLITNVFRDMSSQMLLRVSTTQTHHRSSRSFAKTDFFRGSGRLFFSSLFLSIVLKTIFNDFSSILGGFWRPKWFPKSIFGVIFWMFFWDPHF